MATAKKGNEIVITAPDEIGSLATVLQKIANAGINLHTLCSYSMGGKAFFHITTNDNEKTVNLLKDTYDVKTGEAVFVEFPDELGQGSKIFTTLAEAKINIIYGYATSTGGKVLLVLSTSDNDKTVKTITG
jgi:hypothetical protein